MAPTSLFYQSLALAFNQHYPVALSPEVIGYLINHEVAETVKRSPGRYAALFTHEPAERRTIEVRDDTLAPGVPSEWGRAIALFESALRARVPDGIMDALLPTYTTETPASRVASLITFMDAASPFFEYRAISLCGIPRVRLLGSAGDWRALLAAARKLAEPFDADLGAYFRRVLPVLQILAEQADPARAVDSAFWSSMYRLDSESGGDRVNGWVTVFSHYRREASGALVARTDGLDWRKPRRSFEGFKHDEFPLHVSSADFIWQYRATALPMKLVGGVLAVDDVEGFVTPSLSFTVLHAPRATSTDDG